MEQLVFSTIIFADNADCLSAALENISRQGETNGAIQTIVVDPAASSDVEKLCEQYHAVWKAVPDSSMAEAYNLGMELAEGQFVNFALASSTYSENAYGEARKCFDKDANLMLVTARPVHLDEQKNMVHYQGSGKPVDGWVDVEDEMPSFQLALQAWFFRREALKGFSFDETLHDECGIRFVLDVQMKYRRFMWLIQSYYIYTAALEDDFMATELQYQKWWYQDSLDHLIVPMLEQAKEEHGAVPELLQRAAFYLIFTKYRCNMNGRSKGVVHGEEETDALFQSVFRALSMIDNQVIFDKNVTAHCKLPRDIRAYFFYGKANYLNQKVHVFNDGNCFIAVTGDTPADNGEEYKNHVTILGVSNKEALRIRTINYHDGMMTLDANVGVSDLLPNGDYEIYATYQREGSGVSKTVKAECDTAYCCNKCFGALIQEKTAVRISIPVDKHPKQIISFFYRFQGKNYQLALGFDGAYSRLDGGNPFAYWMFRKNWMLTRVKKDLVLRKSSKSFHIKREMLFCKTAYERAKDKALAREYLRIRAEYWRTKSSFDKKRTWLTFDKLYKAGDNGEYFFQYCMKQKDNIDCYYLINEDAIDAVRLKKQHPKNVLMSNSVKAKVVSLHAEAVMSTHAGVAPYLSFPNPALPFVKDLFQWENICIQHGLSIQQIASFQNRRYADIKIYCLASPFEKKNVSAPEYGYSEDMLKLTGLARYDGLVNRDKKLILITPTWRKGLIPVKGVGQENEYRDVFKQSTYYHIYNDLIHDEKLLECARRTGYKVMYLLHPAMSGQAADFEGNDVVDVVPATGDISYETVLCESSLMVTDYSGVQFDFAYMRKPILYYHPDALPPHYEAGGLDYPTEGFGPICTDHEQIVQALCNAMERQCVTEPEYIRRANEFFTYDDHNNCERIYAEVVQWMEKKNGWFNKE